jgi:pyruvate dehydrogenase E2 component (dihydrolipoyllysine-residue acetyltransferase)
MATNVILPALGMAQETGKVVRWLKAEGEQVTKGDPLAEIETDKATVELEAPATGVLANVTAAGDEDIPVGQVIAMIVAPGESPQPQGLRNVGAGLAPAHEAAMDRASTDGHEAPRTGAGRPPGVAISPLAERIAADLNVDLSLITPLGRRIQKADVLAHIQDQKKDIPDALNELALYSRPRLAAASPKARRLAGEQGKDITAIKGSGPEGAVLAADVLAAGRPQGSPVHVGDGSGRGQASPLHFAASAREDTAAIVTGELTLSNIWRIMAERTTQSWTSVPHFYLVREVNAGRLIAWREQTLKRSAAKVTYTDLLVTIVAAALRMHPRLNASWSEGKVTLKQEVHIGLAVAVEEGLVVPVIHQADKLNLSEIARQREELVMKAHAGKLRPQDISGGTFTISNLGMYGVDAFNAIINQPQVAILAVGRIAERVVPVNGQPAVQPMVLLTLSCDHRAVDGARGAQFLDTVAALIEEPLGLLG